MRPTSCGQRTATAAAVWLLFACQMACAYRPVVLVHGIMTGAPSMQLIEDEIQRVCIQMMLHLCPRC